MRQIRLFTPQPLPERGAVTLDNDAAHHLARVLRARVGDRVWLFNGSGWDVEATVASLRRGDVTLDLGERQPLDHGSPLPTHLGLCLSKGERFDWAIQKATELGAHAITPLLSERTEVRLTGDRLEKKLAHWQGVVRSACEQCLRGTIPTVWPPRQLGDWLGQVDADLKLLLHHHQPAALTGTAPASVALLIGPEGGLSAEEVALGIDAGFQPWCLGPRVLRTETAPLVALTALGWRWGDLAELPRRED